MRSANACAQRNLPTPRDQHDSSMPSKATTVHKVAVFIIRGWQPPVAFCPFLCCNSALQCAQREGAEAEARIGYGSVSE